MMNMAGVPDEDKARVERACALLDAVEWDGSYESIGLQTYLTGVGNKIIVALTPMYEGECWKMAYGVVTNKVCYVLTNMPQQINTRFQIDPEYYPCFTRDRNGDIVVADMKARAYREATLTHHAHHE